MNTKFISKLRDVWNNRDWNVPLIAIILLGVAFRLSVFSTHDFHCDEGLHGSYILDIATKGDWLFRSTDVDRPPVFFYVTAPFVKVLGNHVNVLRLPNLMGSIAGIFLIYLICIRLFNRETALWASFLLAVSPYNIVFGPTVFIDVLMSFFILWSFYLLCIDKAFLSGIVFGLALGTKQPAVMAIPVFICFSILLFWKSNNAFNIKPYLKKYSKWIYGCLIILALVFAWSALCQRPRFGMLGKAYSHQSGVFTLDLGSFLERIRQWWQYIKLTFNSIPLNILFILSIPLLIYNSIRLFFNIKFRRKFKIIADIILTLFVYTHILLFVVFQFKVYDRYLLLISPFMIIVLARILNYIIKPPVMRNKFIRTSFILVIILSGLCSTKNIGKLDMGAVYSKSDGMSDVSVYLKDNVLPNSIIYFTREVPWEMWYYCYGKEWRMKTLLYGGIEKFAEDTRDKFYNGIYVVAYKDALNMIPMLNDTLKKDWKTAWYQAASAHKIYKRGDEQFGVYRVVLRKDIEIEDIKKELDASKIQELLEYRFKSRISSDVNLNMRINPSRNFRNGYFDEIVIMTDNLRLKRGINAKIRLNWSKVKLNMDDLLFHSTISVESGNAQQPKLIISKDCFREFLKKKLKKIYAQQVNFEDNNVIIGGRTKFIKELHIKTICELGTEDEKRFIFRIKDIVLENTYLPDYLIRLINKKAKAKQVWELPQLIKADSVYFTENDIVIE
ncbi:MAG: glycosyltransferase family 39 protein [bacterium]|nr:glycosyltransferase family 39 protein [bacterium]